jgi:hypothetical protein
MTMTMIDTKRQDGKISKDKLLRRQQNLLNLVYLQSQPMDSGGGYRIPETVFEQIQTELDFFSRDKGAKKRMIEDQIKKRYRQRDTYRFWKDFLDVANINSDISAKEYLMRIFCKLDSSRHYGSMTHSQYALETLHLALDDFYGTNYLILQQYKFTNPKSANKRKEGKAKKAQKAQLDSEDVCPF